MTKILILEDDEIKLQAIKKALENIDDIEIVTREDMWQGTNMGDVLTSDLSIQAIARLCAKIERTPLVAPTPALNVRVLGFDDCCYISRAEIQALAQRHIYLLTAPPLHTFEYVLQFDEFEEELPSQQSQPFTAASLNLRKFNTSSRHHQMPWFHSHRPGC
ncbi:MAG: hypothetical protein ACI9TY_001439 [Alphaproteobacteria bacterium]|jgi:hypothetical protein